LAVTNAVTYAGSIRQGQGALLCTRISSGQVGVGATYSRRRGR
jgi:hypothetical protein